MADLQKLKARRAGFRAVVTKLIAQPLLDGATDIESTLNKVDRYLDVLSSLDTDIQTLLDSDLIGDDVIKSCQVQDSLIAFRSQVNSLGNRESEGSVSKLSVGEGKVRVRLPKLELRKFDGDPLEWTTFWDTFESSVHSNEDLNPVDKFNYLKGFLSGAAESTVAGLAISNANYDQAVCLLKERFGQKRILVNAHIEALIAIPPASHLSKLRKTFDDTERHIRSLEGLGITAETYGVMMAPMLLSKVPPEIRLIISRAHGEAPWDLDMLRRELKTEVEARERSLIGDLKTHRQVEPKMTAGSLVATDKSKTCPFCGGDHAAFECRLNIDARWEKAKSEGFCFVCLRKNHRVTNCRVKKRCFQCQGMHHVSLCSGKKTASGDNSSPKPREKTSGGTLNAAAEPFSSKKVCSTLVAANQSILMQTATVRIKGKRGWVKARLLFDTGSQRSFITRNLLNRLCLKPKHKETLAIAAFNSTSADSLQYDIVEVPLSCIDRTVQAIDAAVVPSITCSLYQAPLSQEDLLSMNGFPLADTATWDGRFDVQILIGMDHYWSFIHGSLKRLPSGLTAVKSSLGWLVSGVMDDHSIDGMTTCASVFVGLIANGIDAQLQKFWDLESIGVTEAIPSQEEQVLLKFNETISFEEGRYQVTFPWKDSTFYLSDNKELALGRFRSLIRRLKLDPGLLMEYDTIIQDQLKRKFIEPVMQDDAPNGVCHYIPHHPVIRRDRLTTKVRIVYDASAKPDAHSPSLNDCLYKGPDLLGDLFSMLLRFRENEVAIIADIEKAFLQVGLKPEHRDSTRFFWISNPDLNEEPKLITYRFARVPFGVISSPFLSNATLQFHLHAHADSPASQKMKNSLYVDNVVVSVGNVEKAIEFYKDAKALLRIGGMNLREWCTNSLDVMESIPDEDKVKKKRLKVLGMTWDVDSDNFEFLKIPIPNDEIPTKRSVLHSISLVFDPLGLVTPVAVQGKIFMQKLCLHKLDWDSRIPKELLPEWKKIVEQLQRLDFVKVPRCLHLSSGSNFEIHTFADASKDAYAAAVYLRCKQDSKFSVSLLCSKTRVTPIKGCSLPRLELLAILIAVRLSVYVRDQLSMPIDEMTVWSDSEIALAWISSSKPLKQFVSNRVAEIRKFSGQFKYVPTKENPADLPSRGLSVAKIVLNDLWWTGPEWLSKSYSEWPPQKNRGFSSVDYEKECTVEEKSLCPVASVAVHDEDSFPFDRFSSLKQLLCVTSWCFRFYKALKGERPDYDSLTVDEISFTERRLVRIAQKSEYLWDIAGIKTKKPTQLCLQLNLFIDEFGLLRCRGRLDNAEISETQKNPRLLPKRHPLTKLIVRHVHERLLHQGLRHTLSALRCSYWIPRGRQIVAKILKSCGTCKRWEGKPYATPISPALPPLRVTESPPFTYCGIDYAGPLSTMEYEKVWICLFTCAVTRAVHLEAARNLTSYEFILCLRRFIASRGTPSRIVSDNAKTFKMAKLTLESIWAEVVHDLTVQDYVRSEGIRWTFNVERAPWWGGFFERMVGLVKRTLKKSIGKASLTFAELETQLFEISAVLNSRPLTFVYTSLDDGKPLSPNDLCGLKGPHGFPSLAQDLKDEDYIPNMDTVSNLKRRVKFTQKVTDQFWAIWRREYLCQLREYHCLKRSKKANPKEPAVGDVVLIYENLPRARWKLGVITTLISGRDGKVRAAAVKVGKNSIQRPLQLLYPLEITGEVSKRGVQERNPVPSNSSRRSTKRQAAIEASSKIKDIFARGEDVEFST